MKRSVIIIGGLCWGLLLLLVKKIFQIPNNAFCLYCLILAGIAIVGPRAFYIFNNCRFLKKMKGAQQLWKANRVEEYIAEVESLRRRTKGRYANRMLAINLSAGYSQLKQYDKAVELLESVSNAKLPGDLKLVHRLNLCLCYFYQKQTDRAMALYESSQRIFAPYRNKKPYGGNIAVLDIYAAISIKDYTRAAQLLQTARNTWDDSRFLEDYCYLEESIHQPQEE